MDTPDDRVHAQLEKDCALAHKLASDADRFARFEESSSDVPPPPRPRDQARKAHPGGATVSNVARALESFLSSGRSVHLTSEERAKQEARLESIKVALPPSPPRKRQGNLRLAELEGGDFVQNSAFYLTATAEGTSV